MKHVPHLAAEQSNDIQDFGHIPVCAGIRRAYEPNRSGDGEHSEAPSADAGTQTLRSA